MANAATQNKNMPDSVIEKISGAGVEKDAGSIQYASRQQQVQASRRQGFKERLY